MTEKIRIAAMMPVRNEADRYLPHVLAELSQYVDTIVVLDDASIDATPEVCRSFPKVVYHRNEVSLFMGQESTLRSQLWQLTVALRPQWILAIDADEVFEERMKHEIGSLIDQDEYDAVEFRLFDFWGGLTHYRVDGAWDPWVKRVRMLFRYRPGAVYTWPDKPFHCPRAPQELLGAVPVYQSDIRVKHFGWARPEDVQRKFEAYRQFDNSPHLQSVTDDPSKVLLEAWIPAKVIPF